MAIRIQIIDFVHQAVDYELPLELLPLTITSHLDSLPIYGDEDYTSRAWI